MRITISRLLTILATIGEEDTVLGFQDDMQVQQALDIIEQKIIDLKHSGELADSDCLIEFI